MWHRNRIHSKTNFKVLQGEADCLQFDRGFHSKLIASITWHHCDDANAREQLDTAYLRYSYQNANGTTIKEQCTAVDTYNTQLSIKCSFDY